MIPKGISRQDVLQALREIDTHGVPPGRVSSKYHLINDGKCYPPKYVVSLAAKYRFGKELDPGSFNGGTETNSFLRSLGLHVVPIAGKEVSGKRVVQAEGSPSNRPRNQLAKPQVGSHDERCARCKERIADLLRRIYGEVEPNARLKCPTRPEHFTGPAATELGGIYRALQSLRGHKDFVRSDNLPRCDFFVPRPGFVLEFDETQHFTAPRALALKHYPDGGRFGFDVRKWIRLCQEIKAADNDPPFRDEQRAWYDTLRDFLPDLAGLQATLRLYSKERTWCKLDPQSISDVDTFRQVLGKRAHLWTVEFHDAFRPVLARIVMDGPWPGDLCRAQRVLRDIAGGWPRDKKVTCLTTCGAFLRFEWPRYLPAQQDNRFPSNDALSALFAEATRTCDALLDGDLAGLLSKCTDYLSIGIDTAKEKISTTQFDLRAPHAELVLVADLRNRSYKKTGKSYPTREQERGLLRNTDLASHFIALNGVPTMVLGCHDLTIFNPRLDRRVTGWRHTVRVSFKELARAWKPKWVLHHAHTTVKKRTWLAAWSRVGESLPSVQSYLGSGAYSKDDKKGWRTRNPLDGVLRSTGSADVMDVIVHLGSARSVQSAVAEAR